MRAMRQTTSLSNFLNNNSDNQIEQIIHQLPTNSIRYQEWQREELIINGNIVKKLRLQQVEQKREDFAIKCKNEFNELRNHVRRVKIQYEELRQMKNNLTYGKDISCQLDYSENFNCKYQDEPSAAFYDRRQLTILPMVIHF
jgi:Rps23 Pro-64 3,4-dihydroxylase Tpa1-like proline 4-hydroxylase